MWKVTRKTVLSTRLSGLVTARNWALHHCRPASLPAGPAFLFPYHGCHTQIARYLANKSGLIRSAKPKGSICLLGKYAGTALWLCTAVLCENTNGHTEVHRWAPHNGRLSPPRGLVVMGSVVRGRAGQRQSPAAIRVLAKDQSNGAPAAAVASITVHRGYVAAPQPR